MTDLSVTASQVLYVSGPMEYVTSGAAITIGQACYKAADNTWLPAQTDGTATEAGANGVGLALGTAAAAGQKIGMARPGAIVTLGAGAAPTAGIVYYISNGAGGLAPIADIGTGDKVVPFCLSIGSNQIKLLDQNYHAGSALA